MDMYILHIIFISTYNFFLVLSKDY